MRSRAVNNGQSRLDDKELNNDIEEAEIKSSSSSRRYDSVGENSYYFSSMMTKKSVGIALFRHLLRRVFVVLNQQKSRDDERTDKGITQKRSKCVQSA